ncbi:CYFA0S01e06722g1_1 [Cyberlindnera fabianii]|uniref:CYFA0S01e06722g1_1 n=2 Tax=Cyberlindnera fabianii TaxID=36022 RepID=A0A061AHM4_CYBFA|nr:CYFA0S01e06722g1_1 [Cyberlindnera fabianii]
MTKFKLTPTLRDNLKGLPHSKTILERQWITTNDILYLHKKHLPHIPLSKLLKGLDVYNPPKATPKYTPEFQKQLDKLRLQNEENEYQELVNRGKVKLDEDYVSPADMAREIRSQITTMVNIIISVLSVVYAIWYWTSNEAVFKLHYRVLLCLFFGILVLVAEVVVFNSYLRKMDEAKTTERKKREIKKVIESVIIKKEQ